MLMETSSTENSGNWNNTTSWSVDAITSPCNNVNIGNDNNINMNNIIGLCNNITINGTLDID